MIQGEIQPQQRVDGPDIRMANLANLMNGKDHKAKSDIWYGASPDIIDARIRDNTELGKYIVPTTTGSRPCAPTFFAEVKGPGSSSLVMVNQACFDGAVGARGIHKLQTYGQRIPTYDHRAYTITATYLAGTLKMYAHHVDQPNGPGIDVEYYMRQLNSWALSGDRLRKGTMAFRNAVGWTEVQRNTAIEHANIVARDANKDGKSSDNNRDASLLSRDS